MNAYLRDQMDRIAPDRLAAVGELAESVADAVDSGPPLQHEVVLYRGVGTEDMAKAGLKLSPGATIEDKAVFSSSLTIDGARAMVKRKPDGVILRMRTPKGTKATYVEPITQYRKQYELVLPRGTAYRVIGKSGQYKGIPIIDVEIIR